MLHLDHRYLINIETGEMLTTNVRPKMVDCDPGGAVCVKQAPFCVCVCGTGSGRRCV